MYEKEEKKLNDFKNHLEQLSLPIDKADQAISQGLERAKREKMHTRAKRKRTLWSLAAAALLILTLVTTIRVSPTFANAVASLPGMEKFVELIQDDKGLTAIFENDYYQSIGESQTIGHTTLTIDGVILDESGMNIFYTIESPVEMNDIVIENPVLLNQQKLDSTSISYSSPASEEQSPKIYTDIIKYAFDEPTKFEDLSFTLELETLLNNKPFDFSIPFTIPENTKPSITYEMGKEVEVDGQKFSIDQVTIHPLRVSVKISFDPTNTKKILQFEDMRLEDEDEEIWSSATNGISASNLTEDGEVIYYLQSNYFEKPKQLYLRIDKIQAVDQEDSYFMIDTDQNLLLHSPKDNRLTLTKSNRSGFELTLKMEEGEELPYGIDQQITDANGDPIDTRYSGISGAYEGRKMIDIGIEDNGYTNPLKVNLFAYPNYLDETVKVKIPTK